MGWRNFHACVDGLTGFPKAIETVFPQAEVQLCIVHQVPASLNYVSWRQRKAVAADLQTVYRSATAEEAYFQLKRSPKNGTVRIQPSVRCGAATGST